MAISGKGLVTSNSIFNLSYLVSCQLPSVENIILLVCTVQSIAQLFTYGFCSIGINSEASKIVFL